MSPPSGSPPTASSPGATTATPISTSTEDMEGMAEDADASPIRETAPTVTTTTSTVPVAAAAAAACDSGRPTLAEALMAVETLVQVFGYDVDVANQAVDAVGIDVTACYNYILDQGLGEDKGGAITPIDDCPHLEESIIRERAVLEKLRRCRRKPEEIPCCYFSRSNSFHNSNHNPSRSPPRMASMGGRKGDYTSDINNRNRCPLGENWMCLTCAKVYCSRYVNGHGIDHWKATQEEQAGNPGHCIQVSLADLSVWCHVCNAYLNTCSNSSNDDGGCSPHSTSSSPSSKNALTKIVERLQNLKFPPPAPPPAEVVNGDCTGGRITDPSPRLSKKQKSAEDLTDYCGSSNNSTNSGSNSTDDDEDNNSRSTENARGSPYQLDSLDPMDMGPKYPFGALPRSLKDVAAFMKSPKCQRILILAGAGMSCRSGIPDFRSSNGLYATMNPDILTASQSERERMQEDPSSALHHSMFVNNPLPCLELNRTFLMGTRNQIWKATLAHRFVELLHSKLRREENPNQSKLVRLYTQNIDGLEDQCRNLPRDKVINVHGSMDRAECALCYSEMDYGEFCRQVQTQIKDISGKDPSAPNTSEPIICPTCGHFTVKPAITLFGSNLPRRFFEWAPTDVNDVDLLIIMGTSLRVAPANTLVYRVPETALRVVVNRDAVGHHLGMQFGTRRDYMAQGDIDQTILELMTHLGWLDDLEHLLNGPHLPESSAVILREQLEKRHSSK